ncbi:uncharacterized protein BX664DRAFT_324236 [Halteromyces radiatus]|uniref:uncharacterized protein n=1 Tax=Halteromyces radiatus TaxID=101107 RepID=UPI00221F3AEC|nr:uncharacterized protein BX664DRAFT_324236 [Halteromyces radiatus]KAI8096545.1 hypothetical protein BX664DRAFT_324236 [Halteromyces radiatus]
MSDLSWCTHCDNAISQFSESLYCSEQCLRADALRNHPLLGYTYPEFVDFPRPKPVEPSMSRSRSSSNISTKSSPDSIHTIPTLSSSHSTCHSSPTLSAYDSTQTPPLLSLSPTKKTNQKSIPSFLWVGATTATTALSLTHS